MRLEADSLMRVMENLHDGLYLTDMNRVIIFWNRAAETITGYPASAVVGSSCANGILIHVDSDGHLLCKGICPLAATIADGKPRETEVCLRHRNGHRVPVSVRVTPLTDAKGRIVGGIELFTDISGQEAARERLRELEQIAMVDTLTKLANRRYIEQELSNRFEEYRRFRVPFGILFMDIDHFKKVNDVYGHDAGDEVLKLVARTFTANARPFDLYGRWGGEEFVGILRNVNDRGLGSIGNRIRVLVENSAVTVSAARLSVTISMGAALARDGDTIETLTKRADSLLYKSKSGGRNRVTLG